MLFVFPRRRVAQHVMMTTYVPLSVAFLDRDGTIINIEDHASRRPEHAQREQAREYALEMNLGWFAKRGIKPGVKIEGIDKAGPAR